MPTVFVYWREGRSQAARDKVAKAIAEAFGAIPEARASRDEVDVTFYEVPPGRTYHAGERLAPIVPQSDARDG